MSPVPDVVLDRTLRALADPTRREILQLLRAGDRSAGEIAERFPMTAASVSHHLGVLREAGLVSAVREGRSIIYSLEATVVQELLEHLMGQFAIGEQP